MLEQNEPLTQPIEAMVRKLWKTEPSTTRGGVGGRQESGDVSKEGESEAWNDDKDMENTSSSVTD